MPARTAVQIGVVLVVAVGLGILVVNSASSWGDWVVFGVIILAAIGASVAAWNRQYPHMSRKRTFTRDSESNW